MGSIAVLLVLISTIPYTISIFKRETTPHIFSYIVWSITMGVAFLAQISSGAGAGAWYTGVMGGYCIFVALISIKYGEKDITRLDWVSLFLALFIVLIWQATKSDVIAITLVTTINAIAYIPTFRKTYVKPYSENLISYMFSTSAIILTFFAIVDLNYTTLLYPLVFLFVRAGFLIMVIYRRKKIGRC